MGSTCGFALSIPGKFVKKVKNFWEEEEFTTNTLASSRSEPHEPLERRKRKKSFLPRTTLTSRTRAPRS